MTRLGWAILALIVLGIAIFGSMLRFGGPDTRAMRAPSVSAPQPDGARGGSLPVIYSGKLAIPVLGVRAETLSPNYGDARDDGARAHTGLDVMAAGWTPVVAAAAGTVEKLFYSDGGGGITAYVRSPDKRWSYYYAHLAGYAPGLAEGQPVAPGTPIGFVGDTGNAGAGNYHLHFGVSRMRPDENWSGGQPIDPYPLLAGGAPRR
ncbi:M23 family metallopeptidase [Sphingomonas japonica]|uniref:Murein DD-endopeptidase MepM/ murein hydrolase activator NlpD n=1 Tax=Sphingomonas japonica TaxID=511662 RepID=A0ABX0U6Q3_9SPHN|nr:M23 family metallopeptidase [Sphingomonas japonica]NIJ24927.1 murein DD-endopeptidase MepM/ murein hydrolase activator NlpD [Sphingomonas japonica]